MAQHEKCFAGSVLLDSCVLAWIAAGQLCIFCGSNLIHPHTLQRSWSTALLVPAPPQPFPMSNHCHISPICFGNCAGNLVCHRSEKPPWPLLAPLFGTAKIQKFWADFEKYFFGQAGKIWSDLHFFGVWVAEFCGNSTEAGATRRFLSRKSIFWPRKSQNGRFW